MLSVYHIDNKPNLLDKLTFFFIKMCFFIFFSFSLQYLAAGWWGRYSFKCEPVDYSNNPLAIRVSFAR